MTAFLDLLKLHLCKYEFFLISSLIHVDIFPFSYNPRRYANDDDDSDMEANFDDIMREEKRR